MEEYNVTAAAMNPAAAKADFIVKTYQHLFGAIALFVGLEWWILSTVMTEQIASVMFQHWYAVLGGFIVVGWAASATAHRVKSRQNQYIALLFYVLAEAAIFSPVLYIVGKIQPSALITAGIWTGAGFTALTMIAYYTRKNFSFLRGMLTWGAVIALMLIGSSYIFGLDLGVYFAAGMVGFAGASVLYTTSNMLHVYGDDQYVAASLELFGAIALMFWYMIQLALRFSSE